MFDRERESTGFVQQQALFVHVAQGSKCAREPSHLPSAVRRAHTGQELLRDALARAVAIVGCAAALPAIFELHVDSAGSIRRL